MDATKFRRFALPVLLMAFAVPAAAQDYAALDDRYVLSENLGTWPLDVLANDVLSGTADGTLTVVEPPAHGTLTTRNDIAPQYFEYRVDARCAIRK